MYGRSKMPMARLIDTHITGIKKYVMFSNFSAASSRTTYIAYIKARNMMTKHNFVLHLLLKLGKDTTVVKIHGIMPNDAPSFYIICEE